MKILTIIFGVLLTLLGIAYYYLTDLAGEARSFQILCGILIFLLGILQGKREHKNPLYGSLMLALLAALGPLFRLLFGGDEAGDAVSGAVSANITTVRLIIVVSAVVFIGLGLVLIKDFWRGWKAFGQFLGDWLARVVLTIFYFTILVPFGLGVRLFADPLAIKNRPDQLWRPRATGDQKLEDVVRQG